MPDQETWALAASVAVVFSALAAILAAVFVSRQVVHMRRSRELDAFLRVVAAGNEAVLREAADWIKYGMTPNLTYEEARADATIWHRISSVVHHFEMLGVIVDRGLVARDLIYDQLGPWLVGTWGKLEPVIQAHRSAKHEPSWCENFELLVVGYDNWARRHPPKFEKRARLSQRALRDYYK